MKSIAALTVQEFKLLSRNAIFWVLTITLVAIVLSVNFLIPRNIDLSRTDLVVYGEPWSGRGLREVKSLDQLEQEVAATGSVGLTTRDEKLLIIHTGIPDRVLNNMVAQLMPQSPNSSFEVQSLRNKSATVAHNLRLMPVFIAFEAVITGFLMAGMLVLGDKQEQVINAYRISPVRAPAYIVSKCVLFAALGTVYALLMSVLTVGFSFDILRFLPLLLIGCILFTLLGIGVAVFFRDISDWFFIAALLLSINMLPMIGYVLPAFSPTWMRAIPSYPILFALEEVLFPAGRSIWGTVALLSAESAVAFVFCYYFVKRRLMSAR